MKPAPTLIETITRDSQGDYIRAGNEVRIVNKGNGVEVYVPLTVTNGAYTIADVVGGLITLPNAVRDNGKMSMLNTVKLGAVQALVYEVWFFQGDITTPAADNAPFSLVVGDIAKCQGVVPIAAADYKAPVSGFNYATLKALGLQVSAAANTRTLYAYIKTTVTTSPGTTHLDFWADFEYMT